MIAIKCDTCGRQFGGGYTWSVRNQLVRDALRAGWKGSMTRGSADDICPDCIVLKEEHRILDNLSTQRGSDENPPD